MTATVPLSDLFAPDDWLTLLDVSLTGIHLVRPVYAPAGGELVDFAIEYLNPAAQRMTGLAEQPGGTLLGRFPHALAAGIFAYYRRVFETGEQLTYEANYQADGLDNYCRFSARRSGQHLLVSFTDTRDQARSAVEETLRASQVRERAARAEVEAERNLLQAVLTQAPVAIGVFQGEELSIAAANAQMAATWGRTPEQILGRPLLAAVPELQGQGFDDQLRQVLQTQVPVRGSEKPAVIWRDGQLQTTYYDFVYQALYDAQGAVLGVIDVAVDVTAQVRARQQVQVLNQELEARVQARTQQIHAQSQRLERLFLQAPAAICILGGPELVFELVNPIYQQFFPDRQLLGKPLLQALPELTDHAAYHTMRQVYDTGETNQQPALLVPLARTTDGVLEDRYFTYIQQPRYDEQGCIDGVLIFGLEVTETVQARQASEAQAQQLRLLTDALPVLIGYLDRARRYQFANESYRTWFGQDPAALLGRPVRDVLGEKAYAAAASYMDRALGGERLSFEATMPYRAGFTRHIRTDYVPDVRDGQVQGFYSLVQDISEQVDARQQVQRLNEELAAVNEELQASNHELSTANDQLTRTNADLDNFVYTASHDLKAPISNLEGLLASLREELPPPAADSEVGYLLHLMQDSVNRFTHTLSLLTDITKLQHAFNEAPAPVALAPLIEAVRLDLAPLRQQVGGHLRVDVAAAPTVTFAEKNLRSVVYNLLSNAFKYHDPARLAEVTVRSRVEGPYLVLEVQDNGLGLELSGEHELFGLFRRFHTHVEGSGVGLHMVRKLVENAGGKIEVVSQVGQGSTFSVYFIQ